MFKDGKIIWYMSTICFLFVFKHFFFIFELLLITCIFFIQLGTGLSIMIAKRNPSLFTTFGLLSCGYILSSYQEVCKYINLPLQHIYSLNNLHSLSWSIDWNRVLFFQVKSVVLQTLNRARFTVAAEAFLKTGTGGYIVNLSSSLTTQPSYLIEMGYILLIGRNGMYTNNWCCWTWYLAKDYVR